MKWTFMKTITVRAVMLVLPVAVLIRLIAGRAPTGRLDQIISQMLTLPVYFMFIVCPDDGALNFLGLMV